MKLRIGTRGSALALAQSRWVAQRLHDVAGVDAELVVVKTSGDRDQSAELMTFGGVGVFTREIDEAQRAGKFEVSVHSLKDLPTAGREGLVLAAVPERAPVEDALVARGNCLLGDLPRGARVGSGSPRRKAQLLALRPDLVVVPIRGNVETRLRKAREGEVDATLLARAGLVRLGLEREITEVLTTAQFVPAAGQGALAIVVRGDAAAAAMSAVRGLDDASAGAETVAERAVLAALGGGCHLPLGCLARVRDGRVHLVARVVSADGRDVLEESAEDVLVSAEELGKRVGAKLVARGAHDLMPKA